MVRMVAAAAESLAEIRARSKFGMAMAAMIRMIATTISSSINEKPFCLRILESLFLLEFGFVGKFASYSQANRTRVLLVATCRLFANSPRWLKRVLKPLEHMALRGQEQRLYRGFQKLF